MIMIWSNNHYIVVKQYILQNGYSILSMVHKILPLHNIWRSWAYIWYEAICNIVVLVKQYMILTDIIPYKIDY